MSLTIKHGNEFLIPRGASDLLKVLAAILVALSHYFSLKASMGLNLNGLEWIIRSQGGNVGVSIFFFLSGYGLMMSEKKSHLSLKKFFKRRFLKVYLPVILITILWLPIYYGVLATPNNAIYTRFLASDIGGVLC